MRRVMPSRMSSLTGGVTTTPPRTTKTFSAEPSQTCPLSLRTRASSKPGELCVGLGEGGVDVGPGDLPARREDVVAHPLPGRDAHVGVLVVLHVAPEGEGHERDLRGQVVEAHADGLVAIEGQGLDVEVGPRVLGPQEALQALPQIGLGVLEVHSQETGRVAQAVEVVERAEDEELLLVFIPVAAQAPEDGGAVVEGVGQETHPGLGVADDAAAEERESGPGGLALDRRCIQLVGFSPLCRHGSGIYCPRGVRINSQTCQIGLKTLDMVLRDWETGPRARARSTSGWPAR